MAKVHQERLSKMEHSRGSVVLFTTKLVSTLKALSLHLPVSPVASRVEMALAMQQLCRVLMAAVGQGYRKGYRKQSRGTYQIFYWFLAALSTFLYFMLLSSA